MFRPFFLYIVMVCVFLGKLSCASPQCFLLSDLDKTLIQEGNCTERVSTCSTFKIPLSLMGFDAEILKDANTPEWDFQDEYKTWNLAWTDKWAARYSPKLWMKNSCIWYSQRLTPQLGEKLLQEYVDAFEYGNRNLLGDEGEGNGLTHSWLTSSLKISPLEQITFLRKLLKQELPVSLHAHQMTKDILFVGDLTEGWKLYGRTGSWNPKKNKILPDSRPGWFVGWVEKQGKVYIFAYLIMDKGDEKGPAGLRAKEQAIEKVKLFLQNLKPSS